MPVQLESSLWFSPNNVKYRKFSRSNRYRKNLIPFGKLSSINCLALLHLLFYIFISFTHSKLFLIYSLVPASTLAALLHCKLSYLCRNEYFLMLKKFCHILWLSIFDIIIFTVASNRCQDFFLNK